MRKLVLSFCLASLISLALSSSSALERQATADYHARRQALAKKAGGVVVLMAPLEPADSVYSFRQDDNFYYLSAVTVPGAGLLIAPATEAQGDTAAQAYTEILFLPPHNVRLEKYTGPQLGADNPDAPKITGFDRVEDMEKLPDEVAKLMSGRRPIVYTDVTEGSSTANTEALSFLKRTTTVIILQDVKPMLSSLRTVKDAGEIALLRKAVDASVAAHFSAMKAVRPSVTEYEISSLMDYEWGRRGCERPSYSPIVGSGHNSTVLHYSDNTNTMKAGDVVVIDAAGEYSMYAADITRTLPIGGHFTPRQKEIYDIVLGAQEAAMAAFQSGKSVLFPGDSDASLTKVAKDYINAHGKDLHGQPLGQYFIHGVGHYLGLNVHDPGDYKIPLGPGMAFTIEPGIYIPEEDIGVRIEDDYLVGPDGKLIKLSAALPSKAVDVEKAMAGKLGN